MAGLFRVYARRPFPLYNPDARLQFNMSRNAGMVKRWPTALLTRAVQPFAPPIADSSLARLRCAAPCPMPSDLATFKMPTSSAGRAGNFSIGIDCSIKARGSERSWHGETTRHIVDHPSGGDGTLCGLRSRGPTAVSTSCCCGWRRFWGGVRGAVRRLEGGARAAYGSALTVLAITNQVSESSSDGVVARAICVVA